MLEFLVIGLAIAFFFAFKRERETHHAMKPVQLDFQAMREVEEIRLADGIARMIMRLQ